MSKVVKMVILSGLLFGFAFVGQSQAASSNPLDASCQVAGNRGPVCSDARSQSSNKNPIVDVIGKGADILAAVAGVGAVIMIVTGGMNYVTSNGNQENVASAKRRVVSAVIGLAIIAMAWVIIRLITDEVLS